MKALLISLISIFAIQAMAEEVINADSNLKVEGNAHIEQLFKSNRFNSLKRGIVDKYYNDGRFKVKSVQLTSCEREPYRDGYATAWVNTTYEVVVTRRTNYGFSTQEQTYRFEDKDYTVECKYLANLFNSRLINEEIEKRAAHQDLFGTDTESNF